MSDEHGDEVDDQVGSVFLPLQRCKRKRVEDGEASGGFSKGRRVQDPLEFAKKGWFFNLGLILFLCWCIKDANFFHLCFFFGKDPVQVAKDSATLNVFKKRSNVSGWF